MVDFTFKSPDGKSYTVTGPEGATQEQAFEMLQSQLGAGAGAASTARGVKSPAKAAGGSGSMLADFFKSLPAGLVSGGVGTALSSGQAELDVQTGGQPGGPNQLPTQREANKLVGNTYEPQGPAGRVGYAMGEAMGTPTSYLGPGSMAGKAVTAGMSGLGAQVAGEMSDTPTSRFIGGAIGGMLPRGAARAITPSARATDPAREAALKDLRGFGVEPSAGDVLGSSLVRGAERQGDRLGGNESYRAVKLTPEKQFSSAAVNRMGEQGELATPEVIQQARQRIGDTLERMQTKLPIEFNNHFVKDFTAIEREILKDPALKPDAVNQLNRMLDQLLGSFQDVTSRGVTRAVMSGKDYQGFTRHGTPLARMIDDVDPNIAHYAVKIRSAIDDAMERSARTPARKTALSELREARRQWFNQIIISKSVTGPGEGAQLGLVSPEKLRQNLTSGQDNKLRYAASKSNLYPLARAGSAIMTPHKESTTFELGRSHGIGGAIGAAAGTAVGHPLLGAVAGAAAPGAAGRAVNSKLVQRYLKNRTASKARAGLPPLGLSAARGGVTGTNTTGGPQIYE